MIYLIGIVVTSMVCTGLEIDEKIQFGDVIIYLMLFTLVSNALVILLTTLNMIRKSVRKRYLKR